MKLNLGCGAHKIEGYLNVDKYPPADFIFDLEELVIPLSSESEFGKRLFPYFLKWPWEDDSIDEVVFHHSLEHMGETVAGFKHIIQELYRVCKHDAIITINVPHPRHDNFINDPTHVRIITPLCIELFSVENNQKWIKDGSPNTPLALQWCVDFRLVKGGCKAVLDEKQIGYPEEVLKKMMFTQNNVLSQYQIVIRANKPFGVSS